MKNLHIYITKLRQAGLRPTKQRVKICRLLFDRKETFHFTVEQLKNIIETKLKEKISLATVYNTVNTLEKKGFLKEIPIEGNKTYYDTNIFPHHHFFDRKKEKLTDIKENKIFVTNVPKPPRGKKIHSVEVLIKVDTDNHNQESF